MTSQLEGEPAVAGEDLPELVQGGTALGQGDQAFLGRSVGGKRGLVAKNLSHAGRGKPAQKEPQSFDDRPAIAGISLGQECRDHGVTDQPFPVEHV